LQRQHVGRDSTLLGERRVELPLARREVEVLNELTGLGGAVFAVHAAILPLHRERTLVADLVEGADDLLEVYAAAARRPEVRSQTITRPTDPRRTTD
jgi:hypothetical protein